MEIVGKWQPDVSWADFSSDIEWLEQTPRQKKVYEMVGREYKKGFYHLTDRADDSVVRHYFGDLSTEELKPHGFGYTLIQGGVRPALMRGYFWRGHFRYGQRIEL